MKKVRENKASTPALDAAFAPIARAFKDDPEVSLGRMFGSVGLKVKGKVFAMVVKGRLVAKLPKSRVDALVDAGRGAHFDPGHGKLMKEWVSVPPGEGSWLELAQEAHGFVKGGAR